MWHVSVWIYKIFLVNHCDVSSEIWDCVVGLTGFQGRYWHMINVSILWLWKGREGKASSIFLKTTWQMITLFVCFFWIVRNWLQKIDNSRANLNKKKTQIYIILYNLLSFCFIPVIFLFYYHCAYHTPEW